MNRPLPPHQTQASARYAAHVQLNDAAGFTLIELMVAIALGLIIVAAGLSLYLTGQRSNLIQQGLSEIQQNAIFGLSMLTHDVRHANLNTTASHVVNNKQEGSGVVFTVANLPSSLSTVSTDYLTQQDVSTDGTTGKSDQLTIQYIPQYDALNPNKVYNCEGAEINPSEGRTIVQRYFVQEFKNGTSSYNPKRYALYCDAGSYLSGESSITGLGSDAQILIKDVDAFKVKLGLKRFANAAETSNELKVDHFRYSTITNYLNSLMPASVSTASDYFNVVSVNVGVLVRSSHPVGSENLIDNAQTQAIFADPGEDNGYGTVTPNDSTQKFLRQSFSQVVAIRNTLGGAL